jgi:hypothetical protein
MKMAFSPLFLRFLSILRVSYIQGWAQFWHNDLSIMTRSSDIVGWLGILDLRNNLLDDSFKTWLLEVIMSLHHLKILP